MIGYRNWTFSVRCPTRKGEVVCVSGSCPELGSWKPEDAVKMDRIEEDTSEGNRHLWGPLSGAHGESTGLWRCQVRLPVAREVRFRYCVCLFVEEGSKVHCVVRRWETNVDPRKITCHDELRLDDVHNFGYVGRNQATPLIQTGWLNGDTLVELKLYEKAVHLWKRKHQGKRLYVKLTPVDVMTVGHQQSMGSFDYDDSIDVAEVREKWKIWPLVNVATLTTESDDTAEPCIFRPQNQFGAPFDEGTFLSFQAQVFDLKSVAFLVDIFARDEALSDNNNSINSTPPEHIGSCYVLPTHFKSTEGRMETPIVSKRFQPIGQFCAVYLIVTPMKEISCDLEVSFAQHWKSHWKGLDVGHRGLGNSYTKSQHCSSIRENTIASLKNAVEHGADIVEFDVQVSKDLIPVIYHNFNLNAAIVRKKPTTGSPSSRAGDIPGNEMLVQMPLKNLTLEQLQSLKLNHVEEESFREKLKQTSESSSESDEETSDEHEEFPTLEKALHTLNPHAGFNIEIKWDMELADGTRESHNAFEMNLFIDVVLKTVLLHGGKRKIVFSSFNPDICTMLRSKQNKYPTLFLTQGETTKYEPYRDPRTFSVLAAARFVEMTEILGVNAMAEDLLRDPKQVDLVKKRGQVIFCWTDDNNEKETVEKLKKMDIDGIVYDRMDMNNSKEVKESIFLIDSRLEEEALRSQESACSCSTDPATSASQAVTPLLAGL